MIELSTLISNLIQNGKNFKVINDVDEEGNIMTEIISKCDCDNCKKMNREVCGYFFYNNKPMNEIADDLDKEDIFFDLGFHESRPI